MEKSLGEGKIKAGRESENIRSETFNDGRRILL
jgi:hypothetical protein